MGAINFMVTVNATSPAKGFDLLVEEAIYRHGNDAYNGTISTCTLGQLTKSYPGNFKKNNKKKAEDLIEDKDYGEKWVAHYIDLGIVGYQVSVPKFKKIADKQWKDYFLMVDNDKLNSLSDAKEYALRIAARTGEEIKIYKINRKNRESLTVAKIEQQITTYKTKPKKIKNGGLLKEKKKYIFYGWASY